MYLSVSFNWLVGLSLSTSLWVQSFPKNIQIKYYLVLLFLYQTKIILAINILFCKNLVNGDLYEFKGKIFRRNQLTSNIKTPIYLSQNS